MRLLALFIGLLTCINLHAQENEDIVWFESFFLPATERATTETLNNLNERVLAAIETKDLAEELKLKKELGLIHLTQTHNYEKALDCFIDALTLEDSLHQEQKKVFTYLGLSKVFEAVGDFNKCTELLESAKAINESTKNIDVLVLILNEMGKINAALGLLSEARENYELVLEYNEELDRPSVKAEALYNLGHLNTLEGDYPKALENHRSALAIQRSIYNREKEARLLNDIGELYLLMKNEERAYANHLAALEIRQSLKDKVGVAESYNNIGVLYYRQKNYERAVANLQLGLASGQEAQAQQHISRSYEYLSLCYEALKDYKQAFEYKQLHLAIIEFIQNEKTEQKLLETQNRYVIEQKESEISDLEGDRDRKEKELQNQRQFRNLFIVLTTLTLVVLALIIYLYMIKTRSNKILQVVNSKVKIQNSELQNLNATKDKFFSILGHDLKGPLNSLSSFSNLLINYTDSLSKEEIQQLATDLDKSIKNLYSLLENLLEWSRSQTGNIAFTPEIFDLTEILEENKALLQAQAENKKIEIINSYTDSVPVNTHKHSINTVIRNLISNAIKFTPEGGTITTNVKKEDNFVVVSVADTGVGMSQEVMDKLFRIDAKHSTKGTANEKGTGLGLILCREFVEKNGGKIWVTSEEEKGSVFSFSIPI